MVDVVAFLLRYKLIIIFYAVIIALLYIKRKKIDVQAKFIFMYRMKWGLKWMDRVSSKYRQWVVLLGYVGTGVGFLGMIFISYLLIQNAYLLITKPAVTSGVSIVLPGVNIPGLGVLPFWYWIIAIFLIALIHEFSHGVVARAHNIKVKNTGLVLFGPIIGAFVEPDEKKLPKEQDVKQYSVYAAGAFSNIILGLVAVLLLNFAFVPLENTMVDNVGFTFDGYINQELPAAQSGIEPGTIITGVNGKTTNTFQEFSQEISYLRPGEEITLMTQEQDYTLTLGENPDDVRKPFLGITEIHNEIEVKDKYQSGFMQHIYYSVNWLSGLLRWLFLLSLGIGLFNLLPLPIVDGGRMMQTFLHRLKGMQKGELRYRQIGMFFLLLLLLNLVLPFIMKLF